MGVKIKVVELSNGENLVDNKVYAEHFAKLGINDISHISKNLGIVTRHIKNKTTTMLDICVSVAKKALESADLKGTDIDCVILATVTPEFSVPPTSAKILAEIGSKPNSTFYDIDSACVGSLQAIKQAYALFSLDKNLDRIMIVGYDDLNSITDEKDPITYGTFGDTATAVILERTVDEESGYMDSTHLTDSTYVDNVRFPGSGNTSDLGKPLLEKHLVFKLEFMECNAGKLLRELLVRNELEVKDVKAFCLAQSGPGLTHVVENEFNLERGTIPFYGKDYGYTGTSCTLVSLYEQIKASNIKSGDLIAFWGIGVGFQDFAMLIRF